MKHFRPIKTFATWLLDEVTIPMTRDEGKRAEDWIESELKLRRAGRGDLNADIYSHSGVAFSGDCPKNFFNFPTAEYAQRFQAKFGGGYSVRLMKENPRKNEEIFGNFTLDDLVYLYGDPLPNVIQFHLVDLEDRLSGFFDRYKYMHQHWAQRSHWLPSAFVYVQRDNEKARDILRWLHETLQRPGDPENHWQQSWESSIHGIYEFDDPSVAAMFKLAFGGGEMPSKLSFRRDSVYEKLKGPVSGISAPKDSFGTWERQASIPDYRIPRGVD